ncbi:MAG: hypothetical protein HY909_18875 [Deltaproteobacteria bacterium]|nr:hypothetical protein [Deltaproteobacteria bacterium]
MRVPRGFSVPLVLGACLGAPELPPRPEAPGSPSLLVPGGDPARIARFARVGLRFRRPLGPLPEDAGWLFAGSPSARGARDPLPARATLDPRDPGTLWVQPSAALRPDQEVTLVVPTALRAADGAHLSPEDARSWAFALRVAPARACGPVLALAAPEAPLPTRVATLWVRFDRPVFSSAPGRELSVEDPSGLPLRTRSGLDCEDPEGGSRCGWVQLLAAPAEGVSWRVTAPRLHSRRGVPAEEAPRSFTVDRAQRPTLPAFATPVVCAPEERAAGGACVLSQGRWLVVRAATDVPSVLRGELTAGVSVGVALSGPSREHTLRLPVPSPGAVHALRMVVYGSDGARSAERVLWPLETTLARPRVRVSEVLSRPLGESAQEYVELFNAEARPAWVGGYLLRTGSGASELPREAVIPARGRALVVGPAFDPRGSPRRGDPPVEPGAVVWRLGATLASQGLRDSGADLWLTDPQGVTVSFFPGGDPALAPRAGVGLVRAEPDLEEGDPAAWAYDEAGGSTPGGADRLR